MASTADDWLYNDDLDVSLPGRGRLDTDSQTLDGEDLLDDMLTAPSSATLRTDTPTNDDELLGPISHDTTDTIIEVSIPTIRTTCTHQQCVYTKGYRYNAASVI
jgi:hypothetical protein